MKSYEIDIMNEKVYVDPTFIKKAGNLDTAEFKKYMELKRTLPGFACEEKKLNADKNTYKGLKEDVMEAFILFYEEGEAQKKALEEFKETLAESIFKKEPTSNIGTLVLFESIFKKNKGSYVRSWFLKKYKKQYNESSFALNSDGKVVIQQLKNGATAAQSTT